MYADDFMSKFIAETATLPAKDKMEKATEAIADIVVEERKFKRLRRALAVLSDLWAMEAEIDE